MAGLYLHIPFCKKACTYCDFHFSTSMQLKTPLLEAMKKEIALQAAYLADVPLQSIYFGGGTPSLLTSDEIHALFETIHLYFHVLPDAEITLEANPDDLDTRHLNMLKNTPINRLSIGVQSFFDEDLKFMGRVHSASEALDSIRRAQDMGFSNLSVDLIYAAPTTSMEQWAANLNQISALDIPHLSCYCLTVEEKTELAHQVRKGLVQPIDDAKAGEQFRMAQAWAQQQGYVHYEISNFAKEGHLARHNTAYWKGVHYLGIGPSAHSFNGVSRHWNVANNARYVNILSSLDRLTDWPALKGILYDVELLSPAQRYNEWVMTGLRTIWGLPFQAIPDGFAWYLHQQAAPFIENGQLDKANESYVLSSSGKLLANTIMSDLFFTDEED